MKRVLVAVLLSAAGAAHGAFQTGNELYASCTSESTREQTYCLGYIMGAVDMGQSAAFCAPAEMTGQQARDLTVRYLRERPDIRHKGADLLIYELFRTMYPCKTQPGVRGI